MKLLGEVYMVTPDLVHMVVKTHWDRVFGGTARGRALELHISGTFSSSWLVSCAGEPHYLSLSGKRDHYYFKGQGCISGIFHLGIQFVSSA